MTENYTIEQLEKTFKEHAERFNQDINHQIKKFESQGEKYPFEEFNVSEALHVICREINQLKSDLKILLTDDQGISDEQLEVCLKRLNNFPID